MAEDDVKLDDHNFVKGKRAFVMFSGNLHVIPKVPTALVDAPETQSSKGAQPVKVPLNPGEHSEINKESLPPGSYGSLMSRT